MLSAGTYRGRLGDTIYSTNMPRAGEVEGLGYLHDCVRGVGAMPRTQYPFQTLTLGAVGIADPSAENCVAKGGTLMPRKGPGGEYSDCRFPDGSSCEAWAFYRGECAPSGASAFRSRLRSFYDEHPAVGVISYMGQLAGTSLGAYHGYKRTGGKVWPAIGWGLLGGLFWPLVIPVIVAQGPGKRKGR